MNSSYQMNYNLFTPDFPTLEGSNILMREAQATDMYEILHLLQDKDVINEYTNGNDGSFQSLEQIRFLYFDNAIATYQTRQQIQWIIVEKISNKVLGVRELFIDNANEPVTVQGFMGAPHRLRGHSK